MAVSKSQKIQAEIDKVKAKISEQQARLKELEKNKQEAENSEIVDIVRGMSISLEELPLVLQRLRDGTSGQSVQKSEDGGPPFFYADLASRPMPMRTAARARTMAIPP